MSSKAHFAYGVGIEGYEETREPKSIFGKHTGYNCYLIIDRDLVHEIQIKEEHIYLYVSGKNIIPDKFKIWGDAIFEFDYDYDGLSIGLKGGHFVTKNIIKNNYDTDI